jgi:hypothetical protein
MLAMNRRSRSDSVDAGRDGERPPLYADDRAELLDPPVLERTGEEAPGIMPLVSARPDETPVRAESLMKVPL